MSEPKWLTVRDVRALHAEQLSLFGGPPGVRDLGLLESALDRPRNKWSYGEKDLSNLAASYAFGISRNQPFVDGNKRASFAALIVFLRYNGVRFAPDPAETTAAMLALTTGEIDEDEFGHWIRDRSPRTV
jgi:death-on-curing protein